MPARYRRDCKKLFHRDGRKACPSVQPTRSIASASTPSRASLTPSGHCKPNAALPQRSITAASRRRVPGRVGTEQQVRQNYLIASVFFKPLMQEFHASRAAVSMAFTLKLIAAALCDAPIGWLTDRYGARRVTLTSKGL